MLSVLTQTGMSATYLLSNSWIS